MLAELWTAAGKPLEADQLEVYRQSLGEVSLGLLVTAVEADAGGALCAQGRALTIESRGWKQAKTGDDWRQVALHSGIQ